MNGRDLHSLLNALEAKPGFLIMGILNVTPDSFSDGGDFLSPEIAAEHALRMVAEGADIIDIGGESTRPPGKTYGEGFRAVSADEERSRVIPVIEAIRRADSDILISIDTQKASVAEAALEAGADIVNDVSAGTTDPEMFPLVARRNVPIVLMHGHGPRFTKSKIEEYEYADVVSDVKNYLSERIQSAKSAGIKTILADVGIGFAKGYEDNLTLLKHHEAFLSLGVPFVIGVSRKSSMGKAMSGNPNPKERLIGSIAAACYAVEHGAKIIRTHDVKETRQALNVIENILKAH